MRRYGREQKLATCVDRAIAFYGPDRGGATKLAGRMGVTRQAISHWKARGYFPPQHAALIEMLTQGEITAGEVWVEGQRATGKIPRRRGTGARKVSDAVVGE